MPELVRFTNCLLATETGQLVKKDLWIDQERGIILDAQKQFYQERTRPSKTIDLKGNVLSPGFLDIQINGAYGFDFSIYNGSKEQYDAGLDMIAGRIVETGVTSLVPTIITQEKSLYPTLLDMLGPRSKPGSANMIGWHAEGPFLQMAKRGAHDPNFIISAPNGIKSFEDVYGPSSLSPSDGNKHGVRIITAAPEVPNVISAISELKERGITISIGHSIADSAAATASIKEGANLITHLFNAMPLLHHRDPGIVGLLGASPAIAENLPIIGDSRFASPRGIKKREKEVREEMKNVSEALAELPTPPRSPKIKPNDTLEGDGVGAFEDPLSGVLDFDRPFYDLIVDGVHSHPNSVRLAYMAHKEGCILITDAMSVLDPHMEDGIYDWREGRKVVKEGVRLYIAGTDTLAGSVVSMDICVRNFAKFTGCGLGNAIKCATFNPAKCLGIENKKGSFRPGSDADLTILDREGKVLSTWVSGKRAWGHIF